MDKETLKEILVLHEKWLRGLEGGKRANLSGADLSRANFSGANLSGADLFGADLSRANFFGANLSGAYLFGANLFGADLSGADLFGADLSKANLSRANLSGANLSGADLFGADFSRANLSGAYLSRANLSGAYLFGADLSRADFSRANFSGAYLFGADLSRTNLSRAGLLPSLYLLKMQNPKTKVLAWKYLRDGKSPYQYSTYEVDKKYSTDNFSIDERIACDIGLNVATLQWCLQDSRGKDDIEFIEVEFQAKDIIAIPFATDGKFRVKKFKVLRKISLQQAQAIVAKFLEPYCKKD